MKNLLAFIFACLLAGGAWAQTSMVTFNVNMSNETVSEAGVYLGGGVIGGHDAYQLSDTDGDGTYSVTIELANGTVGNYIFLNGNCPDWSCKEDLAGLPCADGTWNDRFLPEVTGDATYSTCFGQCSEDGTCAAPPATANVTFQVDMNDYNLSYGTVNLNGSFNGWCGGCAAMTDDDGDGVYQITVELDQEETFEYKFTLDGWNAQESFVDGDPCTSTIDGFVNRTLTTGTEDATLDVVCYNSCEACTGEVAGTISVTWQVDMSVVGANPAGVFIAGGFQGWDGGASQMTDAGNGIYTYTQEVAEDSYLEWKYLNGPGWGYEETVPGACANSATNRNYQAGTEDVTIDLVCFAECVACDVEVVEYEVTFNVNMANEEVAPTGVYLAGGGNFGNPGDNQMTDLDGDGISGRAQRVMDPDTGLLRLGRFGWKAGTTSVRHQVAAALQTDMGVTTSLFPDPDCGASQSDCGPSGDELSDTDLDDLVRYVSLLGVRARRDIDAADVAEGEGLFQTWNCSGCHVPAFVTSPYHPMAELRDQAIQPFTDLLLHDMGPELADSLGEHSASGPEWRTAPLWGIGLGACVTGGGTGPVQSQVCTPHESYLHDGRARTLDEAIRWHGGEGAASRDRYLDASASEQGSLLAFLRSL